MDHTDLLDSNNSKKQKLKEERKKILKICVNKLQMIQDPESYLCKSVLINNTLKSIQQQHRDLQHSRIKLKRQKNTFSDEIENKKMCLEEKKEEFDIDEKDFPIHRNMTHDTVTHQAQDNTFNDEILFDNTSKSTHVDAWFDEVVRDNCDSQDQNTRTVDISIQCVDNSEENSGDNGEYCDNSNLCSDNFTSISYTQKFSESLIHSNTIPLQT